MLDSITSTRFLEENPSIGQPRCHSWKTWNGHLYNSKVLTQCLLHNQRKFTYHVVLNIKADLTEADHAKLLSTVTKKLKAAGLSGAWIREIGENGFIHYHLLLLDQQVIRETLISAVPKQWRTVSDIRMSRVESQFYMAFYFTKARIYGHGLRDRYASKRKIFKAECKLDKTGTFGNFWRKPKDELYKEIIQRETMIASYKTDDVTTLSYELHDLIDGYVKRTKIERNLAIQLMNEAVPSNHF